MPETLQKIITAILHRGGHRDTYVCIATTIAVSAIFRAILQILQPNIEILLQCYVLYGS